MSLYQNLLIEHAKHPRNFGYLTSPTARIFEHNPVCGDTIDLQIQVVNGQIADAMFHGSGCAISQATASMMTDAIQNRTVAEADAMFRTFKSMLTQRAPISADELDDRLGNLRCLRELLNYPTRVKCALLPWNALNGCLAAHDLHLP